MESSSESALCLSKYVAVYVWTYAGLCCALRRHLRLHLYLDLDLDLNSWLYPALNRALFQKPFQKSFSSPFRSLWVLKYRSSLVLACLQPRRQTLPPRQSVGRPLHGRIVVPAVPDHYM